MNHGCLSSPASRLRWKVRQLLDEGERYLGDLV